MKKSLALMMLMFSGFAFGESQPVALVKTVALRREALAPTVTAYGSVTFAADNQTNISLPYAAQITRLLVADGQAVKRGTPLFIAATDPAAQLNYKQAQNAVTLAHGELQRTLALFSQKLTTQSQLATAEKALSDAEQALAAQRQLGAGAPARKVTAPYDGIVTRVVAAQGDRVPAGNAIVHLGHTGTATPTRVVLGIEPADLPSIHVGAPVSLSPLTASPLAPSPAIAGHVSSMRAAINPQTHLIDVQVDVAPGADSLLLPGTPVKGAIALSGATHWVVPRSSVLRNEQGDYVYQVEHGQARRVAVQTRVESGDLLGVDGPLQATLPVVSVGNYELTNGMPVREARQ